MLTIGSLKSDVALILGVCDSDDRVLRYINRAEDRLLPLGKWRGTCVNYRICTNDACLSWPRQIETVEAWALCDTPYPIRNPWYEFLSYHTGLQHEHTHAGPHLIDRGLACAFDDVRWNGTTPPQLKLYADNPADAGLRVLLKFFDSNGNKVYTYDSVTAATIEGVWVTLVAPPAYATAMIPDELGVSTGIAFTVLKGGLYEVQKPVTAGVIRLYCYDPVLFTQYPLGYYEPSETLPEYRRSLIPGLSTMGQCCHGRSQTTCNQKWVTVRVKLRHVELVADTDSLVLTCREAILRECESIKATDPPPGDPQLAAALHAQAVGYLQDELKNYQGDGATVPLKVAGRGTFGPGHCNVVGNWFGWR